MDKSVGLGRGLSALMGDDEEVVIRRLPEDKKTTGNEVVFKSISEVEAGMFQPRRVFSTEALADLVVSIKEKGVLQPLLVRAHPSKEGMFEIIAGERRYRASKMAGLTQVPVLIKEFDDKEALEVAIIENLQREDLNPLEEAEAYKRLLKEFHYTQEGLSRVVGKSRSHLANMMRLLDLPEEIKTMVEKKELSAGHARALLTAPKPVELAREVVKKGLNVRQTEKLSVAHLKPVTPKPAKDKDIIALEEQLSDVLKTKVQIKWLGGAGKVVIDCVSTEHLDSVLSRLSTGGQIMY